MPLVNDPIFIYGVVGPMDGSYVPNPYRLDNMLDLWVVCHPSPIKLHFIVYQM